MLIAPASTTGCSTTVVPPPSPADPVVIAVTDYGRHSSVVFPDEAGTGSVEYTFGDWNWFAGGHNSLLDAINALFLSPRSTLGRRRVDVAPESGELADLLDASTVLRFRVPRDRVVALRESLDARYEPRAHEALYNQVMELHFVRDEERYRLWHNCNHVTANWLEAMGCDVRGTAYTSKFKVEAPRDPRDPRAPRDGR